MSVVVDTCALVGFMLDDEDGGVANALLEEIERRGAVTSTVFWNEVRNVLVVSERRGRVVPEQSFRSLLSLRRHRIVVLDSDDAVILSLARTYGLTAYDASYLALAVRLEQPLATLDRKLAKIAMRAGAAVWSVP